MGGVSDFCPGPGACQNRDIRSLCDIRAMGTEEQLGLKPRGLSGWSSAQRHRPGAWESHVALSGHRPPIPGRECSGPSVPALWCEGSSTRFLPVHVDEHTLWSQIVQKEVEINKGPHPTNPPRLGQRLPAHCANQSVVGVMGCQPPSVLGSTTPAELTGWSGCCRPLQWLAACSGLRGGMGTSRTQWERTWVLGTDGHMFGPQVCRLLLSDFG